MRSCVNTEEKKRYAEKLKRLTTGQIHTHVSNWPFFFSMRAFFFYSKISVFVLCDACFV